VERHGRPGDARALVQWFKDSEGNILALIQSLDR
jgi:hypothetical protein